MRVFNIVLRFSIRIHIKTRPFIFIRWSNGFGLSWNRFVERRTEQFENVERVELWPNKSLVQNVERQQSTDTRISVLFQNQLKTVSYLTNNFQIIKILNEEFTLKNCITEAKLFIFSWNDFYRFGYSSTERIILGQVIY